MLYTTLFNIIGTKRGFLYLFIFSMLSFLGLFLASESALIFNLLSGSYPTQGLSTIIPDLLQDFIVEGNAQNLQHKIIIAILFGLYITMLVELFRKNKHISVSGISLGILSLAGVSLGITCLSCGFVGVVLVFSLIGFGSSSLLASIDSNYFYVFSEITIITSITLVLYTINKFNLHK